MVEEKEKKRGPIWPRILLVACALIVLAAGGAFWWVRHNIYAGEIKAPSLSRQEQQDLQHKLNRLEQAEARRGHPVIGADGKPLEPEPYSETDASREIVFSEREVNALISRDPTFARHVAVALSPALVSVTTLIPFDPEVPVLGGKTLRVRMGVKLDYQRGAPVVALQGVSLGGIPLPKAWLLDLKGKNLVEEFGGSSGFWRSFADGIEALEVGEGQLRVKLKE